MSIEEEVSAFDMRNLIGGPLSAAAKASVELRLNTLDFINKVGFDSQKKDEMMDFYQNEKIVNPDSDETNEGEPLLAPPTIPKLLVEEAITQFAKKVKESKKD